MTLDVADFERLKDYDFSMTTEQLQKLHQMRPFQPFAICLGDGQRLLVRHPEMLSYAPKSRTAVVYRPDGSFEIVDLLLVTGLDVQAPHNGSKRHKRSM